MPDKHYYRVYNPSTHKFDIKYLYTKWDAILDKPFDEIDMLKAKYHLGAFDTVDTSNADYDLITRKTGYIDLGTLDYELQDYGTGKLYVSNKIKTSYNYVSNDQIANMKCTKYAPRSYLNLYSGTQGISYYYGSGQQITINDPNYNNAIALKQALNGIILQYETSTSYTEKVIKGQPINTLDVNGSEFVKDEWEKSSNLFDNPFTYNDTQSNVAISVNKNTCMLNGKSNAGYYKDLGTIKLQAGTYSYKLYVLSGSQNGNVEQLLFGLRNDNIGVTLGHSSGTFTITQETEFIVVIWFGASNVTFNNCYLGYMLTKSDHAYPYQPFNGHIVHYKELETTKQELEQEIEEIVNEESVDVTDTKIIKVSGLDDNLAIPNESQVEIEKVVCGSLARNQLCGSSNGASNNSNNVVATFDSANNVFDINGIASGETYIDLYNLGTSVFGHTLLILPNLSSISNDYGWFIQIMGSGNEYFAYNSNAPFVFKCGTTGTRYAMSFIVHNGANVNRVKYAPKVIDLTINYGSTIANYLASLSQDNALAWLRANDPNIFKYREYGNALVNTNGDLTTTNRNTWDENLQRNYFYNQYTGVKEASNNYCCSENYNRCEEDTDYYVCVINKVNWRIDILWYDINYTYISYATKYANDTVHSPSNAYYYTLNVPKDEYQSENYQHDICINVSDTSFNGKYVSRKQETQTLPTGYGIPKLVDNKLSFDGDEIIGDKFNSKYDIVDLSTLSWENYTSNRWRAELPNAFKPLTNSNEKLNAISNEFTILSGNDATGINGEMWFVPSDTHCYCASSSTPTGMLVYEKAQPTQSIITPIHPMSCYKGGYELQSSDVPYTLTRNYDISIKDQVKTNVEVDREQSNAIKELDSKKVDKVQGKGLSTEDFTDALKTKLDGIETGANKTIVDSARSSTSTNPLQNKVIDEALNNLQSSISALTLANAVSELEAKELACVSIKCKPRQYEYTLYQQQHIDYSTSEIITISNILPYKITSISISGLKGYSGTKTYTNIQPGSSSSETINGTDAFFGEYGNPSSNLTDGFSYDVTITLEYEVVLSTNVGDVSSNAPSTTFIETNTKKKSKSITYTLTVSGVNDSKG